MKQKYLGKFLIPFFSLCSFVSIDSQIAFMDQTKNYKTQSTRSTLTLGFVDVNGDNFDDLITLDEGNRIVVGLYRGEGLPLQFIFGDNLISAKEEWSFAVGDLDGDGMCEIASAGLFNGIKIFKYDSLSNEFKKLQRINTNSYGQGCNFVDINGDGNLDFFLSNDQGESRILINNGNGELLNTPGLIDFSTNPESDLSGNYGSEWIDLDDDGILELFMAKCSQFAPERDDPRRINQLYKKMEDGIYRDIASTMGLDDGAQTWTSVFEDLDNDGDLDLVLANHYELHKILENQNGVFVERAFPKQESIFSFQVLGADFDNNGLIDLYFAGDSDFMLINNGDFEFEIIDNPFNGFRVHAATFGDINRDGVVDVFASYGQPIIEPGDRIDQILTGVVNDNNFIAFTLEGSSSNRQGIGAKVKIYGPWGIQQRNIRGGQGYSMVNTRNALFGIGATEKIDSVIFHWPSGVIQKVENLNANAYYLVQEEGCVQPFYRWAIEDFPLCPGSLISSPEGLSLNSIQWNSQSNADSQLVSEDRNIYFRGTIGEACIVQSEFFDQICRVNPTLNNVLISDEIQLCTGAEISVNVQDIESFYWSTGDTTSSITPDENGIYLINFLDVCGNEFNDTAYVKLIDPELTLKADTVKLGDDLDINIPGDKVFWYKDSLTENVFFYGNQLSLKELEKDTSFFIESVFFIPADTFLITGERVEENMYTANHLNDPVLFDLLQDLVLHQITVYTDTMGEREFLIYNDREELVYSRKVFIDSGKNVVPLEVELSAGANYSITTNEVLNLANLGYKGPRFQISGYENLFPIELEGLISLNGIRRSPGYFFYYDWLVSPVVEQCRSDRVRKDVVVKLSDNTFYHLEDNIKLFPNPSQELLVLESEESADYLLSVFDIAGQNILEKSFTKKININMQRFNAGLYILRIVEGNRSKILKWSKL
jgi:hypothetical protein